MGSIPHPPLPEMPNLCPVLNLKRYLELTRHFSGDQLFRGNEGSNLSVKDLGGKIIEFVNGADPNKHMSVHMLRKIASSLNFFQFMDFQDLSKMTGWKSNRVFYRHYFTNIESLSLPVVAAGKVIPPS